MTSIKSIYESGADQAELYSWYENKLHQEKLWLLQQPVVLPSLFRKRAKRIVDLHNESTKYIKDLTDLFEVSDKQYLKYSFKSDNLIEYLADYDAEMNQFRLRLMSATKAEDMVNAVHNMASFEEEYFTLVDTHFDLGSVASEDIPATQKLDTRTMLVKLKMHGTELDPDLLVELKRVKRILKVYRKTST